MLKAKLTNEIDKTVFKNFGFVPSMVGTGQTLDVNTVFEGVKPFLED